MPEPYAEVIGDPVAHSKSPLIHNYWIERLGKRGAYGAVRVPLQDLPDYFSARAGDEDWRGCNVTAPLKQAVVPFLAELTDAARAVGAVNCIVAESIGLVGENSDVDGVAAALAEADLEGRPVAVVGGGGAARAAIHYFGLRRVGEIHVLLRDPVRGAALTSLASGVTIHPLAGASKALDGAAAIVNASPLGTTYAPPMPPQVLDALRNAAPGITALDMVYVPVETQFLAAARASGLRAIDGLVMLVGQARRAFELFFGDSPPDLADDELRKRLDRKQPG